MDVSAGHIVGVVGPAFHTHFLDSTDNDFFAGILLGDVGTLGIHMGHHHQWSVWILLPGL